MVPYDIDGKKEYSTYPSSSPSGPDTWEPYTNTLQGTRINADSTTPDNTPTATFGTAVGPQQGGFTYEPMVTEDRIVFPQNGPNGDTRKVFSILDRSGNIVASKNIETVFGLPDDSVTMGQITASPGGTRFVCSVESTPPAPVGFDKNGEGLWRTELPNGNEFADTAAPAIYDGYAYLSTYGNGGTHLVKLDVEDGTLVDSTTYANSEAFLFFDQQLPIYPNLNVVFAPYESGLVRVDLDTLSITSRFEPVDGDWLKWWPGSDGYIYSGTDFNDVYVVYDISADAEAFRVNVVNKYGYPYAPAFQLPYDPESGYRVGYAGYQISGAQNIHEVIALEPSSGDMVYRKDSNFRNGASSDDFVRIAAGGRMVYGPDNNLDIWCWDTADGSLVWNYSLPSNHGWTSQVVPVSNQILYIDWGPNGEVRPVRLA